MNLNNIGYRTGLFIGSLILFGSCSKKATDYRKFLNSTEITYPGVITNASVQPGNGRIQLSWHPSPDPSVTKYVVYWNNYADSTIVAAVSHNPQDTVTCQISNLEEYNYTFFINSFDAKGNKSILTEIDNARVYGHIYQTNLLNRPVNTDAPFFVNPDQSVTLHFLTPDTININTKIKYTNTNGQTAIKNLDPTIQDLILPDYKFGTPVLYQSSYIPTKGAIDTFFTNNYDTFPNIFRIVQCDKSLFAVTHLPYDMNPYDGSTQVWQLWDGNPAPKDYPNVFHSDGGTNLPAHISFDMGKIYNNLTRVQEIGRTQAHNPMDFEVWGIADTTGAELQIPGNDANWKATAQAKGWTLLKEVIRNDDGIQPFNADLISNPPPVRFIMIRFIKTIDNSNYVNLSQITFWNKE